MIACCADCTRPRSVRKFSRANLCKSCAVSRGLDWEEFDSEVEDDEDDGTPDPLAKLMAKEEEEAEDVHGKVEVEEANEEDPEDPND